MFPRVSALDQMAPARPGDRLGQVALAVLAACALSTLGWLFLLSSQRATHTCPTGSNAININSLGGSSGGAAALLLVVASFQDDNAWVYQAMDSRKSSYPARALIYEMSSGSDSPEDRSAGSEDGGAAEVEVEVRHLPSDRGHEAMAFLSAIVDEYDRLPADGVVAFLHGHSTSWHSRLPGAWVLKALLARPPTAARLPRSGYLSTQCRPVRWGCTGLSGLLHCIHSTREVVCPAWPRLPHCCPCPLTNQPAYTPAH